MITTNFMHQSHFSEAKVNELIKKFSTFYGNLWFFTLSTTAFYPTLFWASRTDSTSSHLTFLCPILLLSL